MKSKSLTRAFKCAAVILSVSLAACSTTSDYSSYIEAHKAQATSAHAVAASNQQAEAARYKALADIAVSPNSDPASRGGAVMALAMSQQQQAGRQAPAQLQIQAPVSGAEIALRWAQILVPGVTTMYGIRANSLTSMNASDNAALASVSTNAAFVSIAGRIQAPGGTTTTTTNTLSGTGVLGTGTYTSTPTTTTNTLGGGGVIGTGTFSTTDNHASTTDNHTVNPTTITPAGRVCSINPVTGVTSCQ